MLDEMRMRTACFARAPQRCTSRLSKHFFLTFQEVIPLSKIRNQLNATALHTAVDMLDPQSAMVQSLIRYVLLPRELLATRFLRRHQDLHLGQRECQEAEILQEPAPRGQGIGCCISNALVMGAATVGVTEKEDEEQRID
jgi:hypothetical protein